MNTPEKCPKCQSPLRDGWDNVFTCGTAYYNDGPFTGRVEERQWCVRLQRDQLSTKLTALESAYAECSEKMKRFRSRWLAAHQELRRTEDRVERAEERVKQLEDETARWAAAYRDLGTYQP